MWVMLESNPHFFTRVSMSHTKERQPNQSEVPEQFDAIPIVVTMMMSIRSWLFLLEQLIFVTLATTLLGVNSYVIFTAEVSWKQHRSTVTGTGIIHIGTGRWMRQDVLPITARVRRWQQQSDNNDNDEALSIEINDEAIEDTDLFDYFDPLLSPHAYPKGIGAGRISKINNFKLLVRLNDDDDDEEEEEERSDFSPTATTATIELSDAFGWGNSRESTPLTKKSYQLKKPFGISLPGGSDDEDDDDERIASATRQFSTNTESRPLIDTSSIFDPTLSPHMYTNGNVPDVVIGDNDPTLIRTTPNEESILIGILLMDHGSRNSASNERLHELAQLYQQQFATAGSTASKNVSVIVKAAHMEIASPSIQDGLSSLLQENVNEIICHPYFLSPGRHVVEDIPQLVSAAVEALSISIPVKTTRPIGSETNIMIKAINSLVNETSEYL